MPQNQVIIEGKFMLKKLPEVITTKTGKVVMNFSLSIKSGKKGFFYLPCRAWGQDVVERCYDILETGKSYLVKGFLSQDSWESGGKRQYKIYVNVQDINQLEDDIEEEFDDYEDDVPF
jgi:single-stranded DNA-binding protein